MTKRPPFSGPEFVRLSFLYASHLDDFGCYPEQPYLDAYRILRKWDFAAYDALKLGKWIESNKDWPEVIVTIYDYRLLSMPISTALLSHFAIAKESPNRASKPVCLRRYADIATPPPIANIP